MKIYPQSAAIASLRVSLRAGAILASLLLFGCASYLSNPNTQSALNSVLTGAVQYATGNDVGAAVDGIHAASYFVRSLQSTPGAANPTTVAAAVRSGGAAPIASQVAAAIVTLTNAGAKPDDANEQVAEQLDAATVQLIAPGTAHGTQASRSLWPGGNPLHPDWEPSLDRVILRSRLRIVPAPKPRKPVPLIRVIRSYEHAPLLAGRSALSPLTPTLN